MAPLIDVDNTSLFKRGAEAHRLKGRSEDDYSRKAPLNRVNDRYSVNNLDTLTEPIYLPTSRSNDILRKGREDSPQGYFGRHVYN